MKWPADLTVDPDRRRFYRVHGDIRRNASDYEVLNNYVHEPEPGKEQESVRKLDGGHLTFESDDGLQSFSYGLPRHWPTVPRVKIALKNNPADTYGFGRRLTISDRAKRLLERIDGHAFEFMKCETNSRAGIDIGQYWLMDCAKVIPHFDTDASNFVLHIAYSDFATDPVSEPLDIRWGDRVPADRHAFICARMSLNMVWDETLVDAWRAARLTGLAFHPLQPPLPTERRSRYSMSFAARRYWQTGAFRDFPRGGVDYQEARERLGPH